MRTPSLSIPSPQRERWQPLRSGFVNLYRYDCEEFHYENGRLLLRGNNGTGKSRVLALQLPFLLDGEVNSERLEPDADRSKKIEWNLLMGRYPDRTGYTWIEFGRREEGGSENYLTLGCGLSAVEGKAGVHEWFFITQQRIGTELELVSDSKQVLSKERLRTKIGSAGQVFDSAAAYRREVNAALFHLDEYRYASLINLLIQLRRPQLTRRLDEHALSRTLSEALPPVSAAVVADVAESFRDLQFDRNRLNSSKTALAAVEQFLSGYRRYAEVAAKRRADRVLAAHFEYEAAMKEVLAAEAECDRSLAELARLKADMHQLSAEEHAVEAEIAAFQQTPHPASAQPLEQLHREAVDKRRDAERAAAELADAARLHRSCAEDHHRFKSVQEEKRLRTAAAADAAAHAATAAGLQRTYRDCFATLKFDCVDELAWKDAQDKMSGAIDKQLEKLEHISRINEQIALAKTELQRSCAERDQLSGLLDDSRECLNAARAEHQNAITSFLAATSDWTAELTELPLPFEDSFFRSVSDWCDRPHGPNPFATASRKALDELMLSFAETRAYLKHVEKTLTAELTQLETELERYVAAESEAYLDDIQRGRMLKLQNDIAKLQVRLDPVIDSISELNWREDILRGEVRAAPGDDGVRGAYDYSVAVSRHVDSLRSRMADAELYVSEKQSQFDQLTQTRDCVAADLGISEWIGDLRALKNGITECRLAFSSFWPALEMFRQARTEVESAWTRVEQATVRESRLKEVAVDFERRAVAAEISRDAAAESGNDSSAEVLQRVARTRERLERLRVAQKEMQRRYHDTELAVTRVDERLRSRTAVLNGDTDRRESAAASLRTFASTGLLALIAPELVESDPMAWSTARTVEVAVELVSRLNSIEASDESWERHQKSVPSQFATLMQTLSAQGREASAGFRDDLFVANAVFAGQECSMSELMRILSDNVGVRQMLFDARSKEILENHLVGKVSAHLRELINAAEEQVRQMNIELDSRPMSSGMKLRFVWQSADPAPRGMLEARQRLMDLESPWSETDRQMLGGFLQRQIETVFSDVDGANWHESLAEALDYRKWHWFGVERYQDGVWKRLTARTYGTGSGGEKAVTLTLPHFAAAAAFYRSAQPLAPRLILLDEAFVGIDADMRAKCMGLIDIFDLDFIMTSEREWGCYPTLAGLAIYQLSTRPDIDAIGLTRWVWNGRQRNLLNNITDTEAVANESSPAEIPV